ncbi:unnamed protein product, partial [Hapterophycus canaliculatus]
GGTVNAVCRILRRQSCWSQPPFATLQANIVWTVFQSPNDSRVRLGHQIKKTVFWMLDKIACVRRCFGLALLWIVRPRLVPFSRHDSHAGYSLVEDSAVAAAAATCSLPRRSLHTTY